MSLKCRLSHVFHYGPICERYVIRLEEKVSRDLSQNFGCTRDQVVHLKSRQKVCASRRQAKKFNDWTQGNQNVLK